MRTIGIIVLSVLAVVAICLALYWRAIVHLVRLAIGALGDDPGREAEADALGVAPADLALVHDMQAWVERHLTRDQRLVLTLYHHDYVSFCQIAELLRLDGGDVARLYSEALEALHGRFGDRIYHTVHACEPDYNAGEEDFDDEEVDENGEPW